jgi:hypothetical protein
VLLGLVRSERAGEILKKASAHLFENRGRLLRELIRTMMATEVEPAAKRFAAVGITSKLIPASLNLPIGPAWLPLIVWLLSLGAQLPTSAIPEVVDLYSGWSMGFLGHDAITPILLRYLYDWVTEIESVRDVERYRDRRRPFNGELSSEQLGALEGDLRTGFLAFCNRTPELAARYLESLRKR